MPMKIPCFILLMILSSCNSISRITDGIEETHYALYQQKALFVITVQGKKVWFVNPAHTRCYFLKGMKYTEKWSPGDTLIIEENLDDFYKLRNGKECSSLTAESSEQ